MKKRIVIVALLGVVFGMPRLPVAWAAGGEHQHKEGQVESPDTVAGIWAEVEEHEEELGKTIADKHLDKVHEIAFEIRDMVNALPGKSKDLPAEKLAKVKSNAKYVGDIADRLDKSGDASDQAATEANFKKLQGFLRTIESQYPSDAVEREDTAENKE